MFNSIDHKFAPLLMFTAHADPLTLLNKESDAREQLVAQVGNWNKILERQLHRQHVASNKFLKLYDIITKLLSEDKTRHVRNALQERRWNDKSLNTTLDRFDELAKAVAERFSTDLNSTKGSPPMLRRGLEGMTGLDQSLEKKISQFCADFGNFNLQVQFLPLICLSADIEALKAFMISLSSEQLKVLALTFSSSSCQVDTKLFLTFEKKLQDDVLEKNVKLIALTKSILEKRFTFQKNEEIEALLREVTASLKVIKRLVKLFEGFVPCKGMWGETGSLIQQLYILQFRLTKPHSSASIHHLLKEKSIYGTICEKVYSLYRHESDIDEASPAIKVLVQWGFRPSELMRYNLLAKTNYVHMDPALQQDVQKKLKELGLATVEDLNRHHIYTKKDLKNFLTKVPTTS